MSRSRKYSARRLATLTLGSWLALALMGPGAEAAPKKPAQPAVPEPPPPPPPPDPQIEVLRSRADTAEEALKRQDEALKRQQEELESLKADMRRQVQAERDERKQAQKAADAEIAAAAERAAKAPPVVGTNRTGLSLTGFVHADFVVRQSSEDQLNTSTGDPLNEDRFMLRRARLRTAVERMYVAGALELDANTVRGTQVRVVNAEASLKLPGPTPDAPPPVMGSIGIFKVPFGFEVLQSDRDRLFMERSTVVRALFPGEYDLGARVQGGWRFLRYAFAVQNGDPIGERAFPVRDPNQAKDFVGRLGAEGSVYGPLLYSGGFSALAGKGFHSGTPATKPALFWQDRNENGRFDSGELVVSPGVSASPSENFKRHAVGLDGRLTLNHPTFGNTTIYGEVIWARNMDRALLIADPISFPGRDLRERGYYLALTQDIGGRASVGVRYDVYNPDRDSTDRSKGLLVPSSVEYRTWALAAAIVAPSGRFIIEYDINRNHLGRTPEGLPTNMSDNVFTIRGEVRF